MVTLSLAWHVCKYKVHKLDQGYILICIHIHPHKCLVDIHFSLSKSGVGQNLQLYNLHLEQELPLVDVHLSSSFTFIFSLSSSDLW